jgi:hypothetical protein
LHPDKPKWGFQLGQTAVIEELPATSRLVLTALDNLKDARGSTAKDVTSRIISPKLRQTEGTSEHAQKRGVEYDYHRLEYLLEVTL